MLKKRYKLEVGKAEESKTDAGNSDDKALLANTPVRAESMAHILEEYTKVLVV